MGTYVIGLYKSTAGLIKLPRVGALDSCSVAIAFPLGPYQTKATIGGLRSLHVSETAYYVSLIHELGSIDC